MRIVERLLLLNQLMKVYSLIEPYLPENLDEGDILNYANIIVKNIGSANKPQDYLQIVSLLSELPVMQLLAFTPEEVLQLFIEKLFANRIPDLKDFCTKVGYGRSNS